MPDRHRRGRRRPCPLRAAGFAAHRHPGSAKPSFAASLSRASVWPTGRTSPESPISPKHDRVGRHGDFGQGRDQRRGDREIGRRLDDAQSAGDVEVDVVGADRQAAARVEHRGDHRQPRSVPADDGAARRAEHAGRPAPGFRRAPAGCPRCRRTPPSRHVPARTAARRRACVGAAARQETAPTGSAPRRGRGRSSRTRRSRRSRQSGS